MSQSSESRVISHKADVGGSHVGGSESRISSFVDPALKEYTTFILLECNLLSFSSQFLLTLLECIRLLEWCWFLAAGSIDRCIDRSID